MVKDYRDIYSSKMRTSKSIMALDKALNTPITNNIDILSTSYINIDNAKGYFLDNIGLIVGISRPFVETSLDQDTAKYSRKNTPTPENLGFETGNYLDTQGKIISYMADAPYKSIIKAYIKIVKSRASIFNILDFINDYWQGFGIEPIFRVTKNSGAELIINALFDTDAQEKNLLQSILNNLTPGINIVIEYKQYIQYKNKNNKRYVNKSLNQYIGGAV